MKVDVEISELKTKIIYLKKFLRVNIQIKSKIRFGKISPIKITGLETFLQKERLKVIKNN